MSSLVKCDICGLTLSIDSWKMIWKPIGLHSQEPVSEEMDFCGTCKDTLMLSDALKPQRL